MSGQPAWHHRPGEHCTDPQRQWVYEDGTVNPGPWPLGVLLLDVDGHWVCLGQDNLGEGLGSRPGA